MTHPMPSEEREAAWADLWYQVAHNPDYSGVELRRRIEAALPPDTRERDNEMDDYIESQLGKALPPDTREEGLRAALTDAIAYAIARAPVPDKMDTGRDIAARLAPLVIESGYLASTPRPGLDEELAAAKATIEAMSGDAADLHDLIGEAAAMRTVLSHLLGDDRGRIHDSGCGICDAGRALLTADHELPSFAANLAARQAEPPETP